MFKTSLLALTGILTTSAVLAQMKKQFTVEKNQNCETVNLCLKVS